MAWIWLRGIGRESGHWGGLPRMLELATGEKVIALDFPGVGAKRNQQALTHMGDLIEQLKRETQSLTNIKLLAQSMGGQVALNWAAQDPRVHQLLLINTASPLNFVWQRFKPSAVWRVARSFLSRNAPESREQTLLDLVSNDPEANRRTLPLWREIARRRPVAFKQLARQFWLSLKAPLPKPQELLHCQIKVICSQRDQVVAPECSKKLAAYYDCPMVVHASAGHDLPLDAPQWLLRQIDTALLEYQTSQAGC